MRGEAPGRTSTHDATAPGRAPAGRRVFAPACVCTLLFAALAPAAQAYDRGAAIDYAWTWCGSSRNPAYCDYSGVGGDCTNFVSQCLMAGGVYPGGWGSGGTEEIP